ncbi:hypothetical protein [Nocardioides rubriscoriae]|uniref:hypothetical protein n=1 Tax=Nocardioides rubriscoriae TaxID=642762 RepID=UPI00147880A4|nr:hypothetical protein [Nocardioides rubriscoriae]
MIHDDAPAERPDTTGIDGVDAVIDAVAMLGGLPLADQVAVFEQAHAELRRTLDDPRPA